MDGDDSENEPLNLPRDGSLRLDTTSNQWDTLSPLAATDEQGFLDTYSDTFDHTPAMNRKKKDDEVIFGSGEAGRYEFAEEDSDDEDEEDDSMVFRSTTWVQQMCRYANKAGRWQYFAKNAKRELCKRKFNFCLGWFSCFMVVVIAAVCYTLLARAPAVFLQQAEVENGQIDMTFEVDDGADFPFINYTQFQQNLACQSNVDSALGASASTDTAWRYCDGPQCFSSLCPTEFKDGSYWTWLIDSAQESSIGCGRLWPFGPLKAGEAVVTEQVALPRGLMVGSTAWVTWKLEDATHPVFSNVAAFGSMKAGVVNGKDFVTKVMASGTEVIAAVKIVGVVPNHLFGKFSSADASNVGLIVERSTFMPFVATQMNPTIAAFDTNVLVDPVTKTTRPIPAASVIAQAPMDYVVSHIIMNFGRKRTDIYLQEYQTVQDYAIRFISGAQYYSDFTELELTVGCLDQLLILRFFSLFLNLILSVILTILFALSTLLIYSLLMISIENRVFELGVHRMVGMTRLGLVEMLLTQASSYSIPAWALGLAVAQIISLVVVQQLEDFVKVPLDKRLTSQSIGVASFLGLLIPMFSAILPIQNALGKNLHDSLDTRHSKTMAVKINIERSNDGGLGITPVVLSFAAVVVGFLIYYLLPLSLLSLNLSLFFSIFFGLLLGMLVGLILLSLNAQHLVERLVTWVFLFWEQRAVRTLVAKNLIAHKLRNRKTAMMFALALGFIIFITVAFEVELLSAESRYLRHRGSLLSVDVRWKDSINPQGVAELESVALANPDVVEDFGWVSQDLVNIVPTFDNCFLTTLGHIKEAECRVWGISPNIFNIMLSHDYLKVNKGPDTDMPLSEVLYSELGDHGAIISAGFGNTHRITTLDESSAFLISLKADTGGSYVHRFQPIALLDLAPRFQILRFPDVTRHNDVLVSFPTLMRMTNHTVARIQDLPMQGIHFKLRDGVSEVKLDGFVQQLSGITEKNGYRLKDVRDFQGALASTNDSMTLIFTYTTYIAMALCVFSLMASMYTNIYEQTKEIAVVRAIGLNPFQVVRVYLYEAFVLVVAASVMGIIIGFIMEWTLATQRELFTEMHITVPFPWNVFTVVLIGATICAMLATLAPAITIARKTVSSVFRTVL